LKKKTSDFLTYRLAATEVDIEESLEQFVGQEGDTELWGGAEDAGWCAFPKCFEAFLPVHLKQEATSPTYIVRISQGLKPRQINPPKQTNSIIRSIVYKLISEQELVVLIE